MKHGKVDGTQREIVQTLRAMGFSVVSLADVGGGCPDLIVARSGRTFLIECKSDRGKLNGDQEAWHRAWNDDVYVIRSALQAVDFANSTVRNAA